MSHDPPLVSFRDFFFQEVSATQADLISSRLAELMLPDGAHLRAEDWTVFYLGQTSSNAIEPVLDQHSPTSQTQSYSKEGREGVSGSSLSLPNTVGPSARRKSFMANDGKPREGIAGNGLLYVLNVVKMKEDSSMRRGAQVKAMALCSPYPYIGIFKASQSALLTWFSGCSEARSGSVCTDVTTLIMYRQYCSSL